MRRKNEITACMVCGSTKLNRLMKDGPGSLLLGAYVLTDSRWTCENCGNYSIPIIFNSEKEYKKFQQKIKDDKTHAKPKKFQNMLKWD